MRKLRRRPEAEREYAAALASARQLGGAMLEVRILSNLALVQVENGKVAAAAANADRALRLARSGEAAGWQQLVYGVAAKIAAARGRTADAARLLDQTFAGADFGTTKLVFKEFHEVGVAVFEKLDDEPKALRHLKAFLQKDRLGIGRR